jgi:hypothetical protein
MSLGTITLKNNPANDPGTLYAVLYSPNSTLTVGNWDALTGSIVAQKIVAGQGTNIKWTPDVANIPGLPGGNVTQSESNGSWNPLIEYQGVKIDYYKVCDNETCS